jgi:uracil-DNA glycosylase
LLPFIDTSGLLLVRRVVGREAPGERSARLAEDGRWRTPGQTAAAGRAAGYIAGMSEATNEEARYRRIFRRLHAEHPPCLADEWLTEPCAGPDGERVARPIAWSRRNGPWRRVPVLWVGAAPGNAGGRGGGEMGAHGTRIPFGGDIAGANLDVFLGAIGLDRNDTFIVAAYNQLPGRGGGEPTPAELASPVGAYPSSVDALRDTIVAAGASLLVALGNVAIRATIAAAAGERRLPAQARVEAAGLRRGRLAIWPEEALAPDAAFADEWTAAWPHEPLPRLLWLTHPSAQNMSPFARTVTVFHQRMVDALTALRAAYREVFEREPPAERAPPPTAGIYALPEWQDRIAARHAELDARWREKGI